MEVPSGSLAGDADFCPLCGQVVIVGPAAVPAKDAPCPHCGELLWFVRKTVGDAVILTFLPGLMTGSEALERTDEVLAAVGDFPRIVLNLSHLPFIASMFLGMLIVLHKRMAATQRSMVLCGIQPEPAVVFKLTKLDTVFVIHDNERRALESF
jgi:anti-sigma B factor antagonist